MNIVHLLHQRAIGMRVGGVLLEEVAEEKFTHTYASRDLPLQPSLVLSTIAISLSPNGAYVASTHGDHTVKIFEHATSECVHVFHGHPRTPWTVKFHPCDSNLVASGCLGCEVRVWDIADKLCRALIRFEYSIISMSFQPAPGPFIAVASGPEIHLWDWEKQKYAVRPGSYNPSTPLVAAPERHVPVLSHSRNVRAVVFHPNGKTVLAAAPDPPRQQASASTPCRLYMFDVGTALQASAVICAGVDLLSCDTLIPQVHLYSDGGLDISNDGRYLFTCAVLRKKRNTTGTVDATCQQFPARLSDSANTITPATNTGSARPSGSGGSGSGLIDTALYIGGSACSAFMRSTGLSRGGTSSNDSSSSGNKDGNNPEISSSAAVDTSSVTLQLDIDDPAGASISVSGIWRVLHPLAIRGVQLPSQARYLQTGPSDRLVPSTANSKRRVRASAATPSLTQAGANAEPGMESLQNKEVFLFDPSTIALGVTDSDYVAEENICLFRICVGDDACYGSEDGAGALLVNSTPLSGILMRAVTSMKLSPSGRYGVVAYGVRTEAGIVDNHANGKVACEVLDMKSFEAKCVMVDDVDEVNIAQFHPVPGCGVVYGTKRGRVRLFQ